MFSNRKTHLVLIFLLTPAATTINVYFIDVFKSLGILLLGVMLAEFYTVSTHTKIHKLQASLSK